jgi:hypothetical protein
MEVNSDSMAKKSKGKVQDRPLLMRVNDQFIATVDEWRRKQPDLPSRTEAIRRLVELGAKRGK